MRQGDAELKHKITGVQDLSVDNYFDYYAKIQRLKILGLFIGSCQFNSGPGHQFQVISIIYTSKINLQPETDFLLKEQTKQKKTNKVMQFWRMVLRTRNFTTSIQFGGSHGPQ